MSETTRPNSLVSAVALEATNFKQVGSLYAQAAKEIAELFLASDHDNIHLYLSAAQDSTTDPGVWNRVISAIRKAIGALPEPLVFTATRDFRPTHRTKAPMFAVATSASVKAEKTAIAKEQEARVAEIERVEAEKRAAEAARIDASVTAETMAAGITAECERLGLSVFDVATVLGYVRKTTFNEVLAELDAVKAEVASMAAPPKATKAVKPQAAVIRN